MKFWLLFFSIALLSIPLGGYQFGMKDQATTIPIYLRHLDPSLYPNDYYYPQPNEGRSIDIPFITITSPLFPNMQTQFFLFYILFHTLWLYSIYRLAYLLLGDRWKALFSLLFFITPKFVGGTGATTYELYLIYRTMAMPFAILSFVFFFERKLLWSAIFMVATTLFHPLTTLYIGYPLMLAFSSRLLPEKYRRVTIFLSALIPFLAALTLTQSLHMPLFMDPEWLAVVKTRLPFAFLSTWHVRDWGNVWFFTLLAIVALLHQLPHMKKRTTILLPVFLTVIAAFLIPIIGELTTIAPLIQIQFARALTLPVIITLILFSSFIWTFLQKRTRLLIVVLLVVGSFAVYLPQPHLAFFTAIALPLILFPPVRQWIQGKILLSPFHLFAIILIMHSIVLIAGYSRDPDPHFLPLPDPKDPWIQAQRWARDNTPKDAIFLYNPYQTGWRVYSSRGSVVEYKDGTASIFSREHSIEWWNKIQILQNFSALKSDDFSALNKKYHFSYIIRYQGSQMLDFTIVYQNKKFIVYKL